MNIRFIKTSEKRQILSQLDEQYGITELPYLFIESGKEKIRAFSGSLSKEEISELSNFVNIELIGLYFIKKETDLRLNIDALQLIKEKITKNVIEINKEQLHEWIRGRDLDVPCQKGTVVIKNNTDFISCGKSNGEKIFNYVPKDRRIRK